MNNDYATGNLLHFVYFKENYRLFAIDLSKQTKLENQANGVTVLSLLKNQKKILGKLCKNLIKMETQKIVNLLNSSENEHSKFGTKKWYVIDSETKGKDSVVNPIKFLTSSLKSSLCDYSDAYVLVTGNIVIVGADNNAKVAFKNCAPFTKCRTEINGIFIMKQNILILQCLCTI